MTRNLALAAALFAVGCSSEPQKTSGAHTAPNATPEQMKELWAPIKGLAGEWNMMGEDGKPHGTISIDVSSGGTIVREKLFAGTDNEMTNIYCMDGQDVLMVHYCHAGNQPHMRAKSNKDGTMVFEFDTVTVGSNDEFYMGAMTLKIIDKDHFEESWTGFQGDKVTPGMVVGHAERKK